MRSSAPSLFHPLFRPPAKTGRSPDNGVETVSFFTVRYGRWWSHGDAGEAQVPPRQSALILSILVTSWPIALWPLHSDVAKSINSRELKLNKRDLKLTQDSTARFRRCMTAEASRPALLSIRCQSVRRVTAPFLSKSKQLCLCDRGQKKLWNRSLKIIFTFCNSS